MQAKDLVAHLVRTCDLHTRGTEFDPRQCHIFVLGEWQKSGLVWTQFKKWFSVKMVNYEEVIKPWSLYAYERNIYIDIYKN